MRALDFDDPVYSQADMAKQRGGPMPPTVQEAADLEAILRKKNDYQKVDLYGEPAYGRSLEVELYIVRDWRRRAIKGVGLAIVIGFNVAILMFVATHNVPM